jgi:hypothetical protein
MQEAQDASISEPFNNASISTDGTFSDTFTIMTASPERLQIVGYNGTGVRLVALLDAGIYGYFASTVMMKSGLAPGGTGFHGCR